MVTDSKEFKGIDPENVEKVIQDEDTTVTYDKPIDRKDNDIQSLSKIREHIDNLQGSSFNWG